MQAPTLLGQYRLKTGPVFPDQCAMSAHMALHRPDVFEPILNKCCVKHFPTGSYSSVTVLKTMVEHIATLAVFTAAVFLQKGKSRERPLRKQL